MISTASLDEEGPSGGSLPANRQDPDGLRKAGSFQLDTVGKHRHRISYQGVQSGGGDKGIADFSTQHDMYNTEATGGAETRPKNVAVYYYIRIN
jgi:hypothetical protein